MTPSQLIEGKHTEVAGAYARCPVLDLSDAPRMDARTYSVMRTLLEQNFAHAGPLIIKAFHEKGWHNNVRDLKARYDAALDRLTQDMTSAERRAGTVFALMSVMGHVMLEEGILPSDCDVDGCIEWGWSRVKSSEEFKKLSVEMNAAEKLLEWAQTSGDVFLVGAEIPAGRHAIAYRRQLDGTLYLPVSSLIK